MSYTNFRIKNHFSKRKLFEKNDNQCGLNDVTAVTSIAKGTKKTLSTWGLNIGLAQAEVVYFRTSDQAVREHHLGMTNLHLTC